MGLSSKSWLIRVFYRKGFTDPLGQTIKNDIADLGITGVKNISSMPTYTIKGFIDKKSVEKACKELLADPITQSYTINSEFQSDYGWIVEAWLKPGVTDFVGESVKKGLNLIGVEGVQSVKTGTTYLIEGTISEKELEFLCLKCIINPLIHDFRFYRRITNANSYN